MEDLVFVEKIRRIIKMRHDDVVAAMVSGGVDNMEKYQYMLGQIRTYQYMSQEISRVHSELNRGYKKGGWIQKATASIKKRGTEGKCTPITKPGCTGRAKALALTFKKMARERKSA